MTPLRNTSALSTPDAEAVAVLWSKAIVLAAKQERVEPLVFAELLLADAGLAALVAENERLRAESNENRMMTKGLIGKLVEDRAALEAERDALAAQVATLRAAVLHMADEINGQLQSGALKDAQFGSRLYWAQVAGVGRTALAATAPK